MQNQEWTRDGCASTLLYGKRASPATQVIHTDVTCPVIPAKAGIQLRLAGEALKLTLSVIPAKAGIQKIQEELLTPDGFPFSRE